MSRPSPRTAPRGRPTGFNVLLLLGILLMVVTVACGGGDDDDDIGGDDGGTTSTPTPTSEATIDPRTIEGPDLTDEAALAILEGDVARVWLGVAQGDAVSVWQRLNSACRYDTSIEDAGSLLEITNILDEDFEDLTETWIDNLGGQSERSIESSNTGDVSLRISSNDTQFSGARTQPILIEPGRQYVLEVAVLPGDTSVPLYVSVTEGDTFDAVAWLDIPGGDETWSSHRIEFQAPDDGNDEVVVTLGKSSLQQETTSFFVDDVVLRPQRPYEEIEIRDFNLVEHEGGLALVEYSVIADGEMVFQTPDGSPEEYVWDESAWRLLDCPRA